MLRVGTPAFSWTSAITQPLACPTCDCWGQGVFTGADGHTVPCRCVLRAIYHAILNRYRQAQERAAFGSKGSIRRSGTAYSRDNEDFLIDVYLCAKRALPVSLFAFFRQYLEEGRELAPATLAHLEFVLGRAFAEIALWPLDRYFGTKPRPKRTRRRHKKKLAAAQAA